MPPWRSRPSGTKSTVTVAEGQLTLAEIHGEEPHGDATVFFALYLGKHSLCTVPLPTVFRQKFDAGRFATVLVVAAVCHHRQRRNELWAFRCWMDARATKLPFRALPGFYTPFQGYEAAPAPPLVGDAAPDAAPGPPQLCLGGVSKTLKVTNQPSCAQTGAAAPGPGCPSPGDPPSRSSWSFCWSQQS